VAIVGWLINGFAPLAGAIAWLKYLSLFYYYAGHDSLARGVDIGGLVVLGAVSLSLTAVAMIGLQRRDLRRIDPHGIARLRPRPHAASRPCPRPRPRPREARAPAPAPGCAL
jgi:uncharacterized membrane protein YedE/YeeE